MDMSDERVDMMIYAIGRAVMELSIADSVVDQHSIIDKLEAYRKETGNVIGKGVNRDAAGIVREGSKAIKKPLR